MLAVTDSFTYVADGMFPCKCIPTLPRFRPIDYRGAPSDKRPFNPFYTHSFNGFNYDLHATDLIVALISAAFQGLKADHMSRAGGLRLKLGRL